MKAIGQEHAVSKLNINMTIAGKPDNLTIMNPFLLITIANLFAAVSILKMPSNPPMSLQKLYQDGNTYYV